jgi:hypothetical protein
MPLSPAQELRNKIGGKLRQNPGAGVTDARAEMKAAGLRDRIRRDVESWPPLTDAQRAELALILAPDGGTNAA